MKHLKLTGRSHEYAKHLRPYGKRVSAKKIRQAGKRQLDGDPSGQACPDCGAVQDCARDCTAERFD